MRTYTAHTRMYRAPVLVPEGFVWSGVVFGPFWLFAHRAWIAGVLVLCAEIAVAVLAPFPYRLLLGLALGWLVGLTGQDLRRWSLGRAGYLEAHVVAAPDEDAALARLLDRRPDLIADAVA